ncbi:hypothetical protein D3C85_703440 [compost metagenome]
MQDHRFDHFRRGRHQIIGEGPGEEAAVLAIGELFHQRRAEALGEATTNLAIDQRRVEQAAGVMTGDVAIDVDLAGHAVDFQTTDVEDKAVAQRAIDLILVVRCHQLRRAPEGGFTQTAVFPFRQQARRPVGRTGDPMKWRNRPAIDYKNLAARETNIFGTGLQLLGGNRGEAITDLQRCLVDGTSHSTGEAAGIVARGNRPSVLLGIQFDVDHDGLQRNPEHFGDDLSDRGLMALPLRCRGHVHTDVTQRADVDGCGGDSAVFRTGLAPLFGRHRGGDVSHVGNRGFDDCGITNAIDSAFGTRLITTFEQLVETTISRRQGNACLVIAGIEQRTGGRAIREGIGRHQVAADHVQRIKLQLHGDVLQQPLQGEIHLRATETTVQAGRGFVGQHHSVAHLQIADCVGTRQVAVHAVESRRFGRSQVGTTIVDLVITQSGDAAVCFYRRFDFGHPIGRRRSPLKMFQTVLDPLHRCTDLA